AADRVWVRLGGLVPGINDGARLSAFLIIVGLILIQNPFDDIPAHIMEAPGIRLFLADLLVFEIAVLFEPGVLAKFARVIAKEIGISRARGAGVFALRFGGQAIELTGLGAQPLAVFIGAMLRHADGGETILAHTETHLDIRF